MRKMRLSERMIVLNKKTEWLLFSLLIYLVGGNDFNVGDTHMPGVGELVLLLIINKLKDIHFLTSMHKIDRYCVSTCE